MKKLLYIALFSIAITANASEKKGVITNPTNEKEVVTDTSNKIIVNNFRGIKTINNNKCNKETFENEALADCGEQGNLEYAKWRDAGWSHREARSFRRDFVRDCRGGTWVWLEVFIFYYD